jgi:dihydrofolate reductase
MSHNKRGLKQGELMRKIVVLTFISLDGVMQAPGGPEEDSSGDFKFGGWTHPYFDLTMGEVMAKQMRHSFDLLLGRKTYDIFAAFWPHQAGNAPGAKELNNATKYVVSHEEFNAPWDTTVILTGKDIAGKIREVKEQDGPPLQVHGSSDLLQTLLAEDLVDELWLKTFPVTLGTGKKLFGEGTLPAAWEMTECNISPSGVIVANYIRSGEIKTGSFA